MTAACARFKRAARSGRLVYWCAVKVCASFRAGGQSGKLTMLAGVSAIPGFGRLEGIKVG